jgi:hypothetical protein
MKHFQEPPNLQEVYGEAIKTQKEFLKKLCLELEGFQTIFDSLESVANPNFIFPLSPSEMSNFNNYSTKNIEHFLHIFGWSYNPEKKVWVLDMSATLPEFHFTRTDQQRSMESNCILQLEEFQKTILELQLQIQNLKQSINE